MHTMSLQKKDKFQRFQIIYIISSISHWELRIFLEPNEKNNILYP